MRAVRWLALVACILGVTWAEPALAGRRPFIWTFDTDIVPKGDVELEQWLWARSRAPAFPDRPSVYWIWWGPVIGLSQHLELAIPFQVRANRDITELDSFEADFRYRLFPRGDDRAFQPLIRAVWHQSIREASPSRVDADLVGSYQWDSGLRVALDLGAQVGIPGLRGGDAPVQILGTYSAGVSYPVIPDELRLSFESFGEFGLKDVKGDPHLFVGPSVAWTFGRMWITAGTFVGLTGITDETPRFMPRLIWAVAL
ncbi:hypothetical protein HUA74_33550 [Myxococcus sp. CA051A]|uniref:Uncharacterized protein n=1 Tax=Myxococcus llanfairpwllgwyngyllgogerychwyrndrobwllllantysiliogogogochensis TaxID=2590453 RepID=A0A540XA61_9BACT|nr:MULTISPECIES: hypothetical protein [Myxococcus]NTX08721.1 hypothetical protein [Myxococcus sp. CA040A]NTX11969.1 hypothetical protein [Myxococcus sp. CA056]NTX39243.1 hypothetical protein [Myxococcus sp. CA033]NTX55305.1 hypothetical protein [Myxococcus sp. CA039A]NTX65596.1 hypothetical protein [Myxococcus sp. CA051A]